MKYHFWSKVFSDSTKLNELNLLIDYRIQSHLISLKNEILETRGIEMKIFFQIRTLKHQNELSILELDRQKKT